ncbi:MAG: isocitrate/isopropylmalate family dehydrogenase, partial [Alphaproteobacteria bacterium]
MPTNKKILMLPGDGIGPEVMHEAGRMIEWMNDYRGAAFDIQEELVGGAAYDAHG